MVFPGKKTLQYLKMAAPSNNLLYFKFVHLVTIWRLPPTPESQESRYVAETFNFPLQISRRLHCIVVPNWKESSIYFRKNQN